MSFKKILLYALALAAPGGLVAIAGYHTFRFVKGRVAKRREALLLKTTNQVLNNESILTNPEEKK